jgi:hypothetical protein
VCVVHVGARYRRLARPFTPEPPARRPRIAFDAYWDIMGARFTLCEVKGKQPAWVEIATSGRSVTK